MKINYKTVFTAVVLLCSYLLYHGELSSQTIPAAINADGYIFIDASFNDSVKTKLLFDTGAGLSVVSQKLFEKLRSSVTPAGIFTAFRHDGERLDAELFSIPKLTIGNHTVYNVVAAVYAPLDEYGIEGVVSLKEFENIPVTVDFKNSTFTIEESENMPAIESSASAVIPLKLHRQTGKSLDIFIDICLNDSIKIEAEFDTGSGYNSILINQYFMKKLSIDSASVIKKPYITPSENKNLVDYIVNINSLKYCSAGNIKMNSVDITFRQDLIYEGLIGSGMFRNRSLTIDIPNSRMLVR